MFDFEQTEQNRQNLEYQNQQQQQQQQYNSIPGGFGGTGSLASAGAYPPQQQRQQQQRQHQQQTQPGKFPLFVGNIEGTVDKDSFRALWEPFGGVLDARLHGTPDQIYRYGFVEFANPESRERAREEMNNFWLKGRPILCNIGKGSSDGESGGTRRPREDGSSLGIGGGGANGPSSGAGGAGGAGGDLEYDPYREQNSGKSKRGGAYKPMVGFGGQVRHNYIQVPVHSLPFPIPKHPFVIQLNPNPKIKFSNDPPTPELYTMHELRLRDYHMKATGFRDNYLQSLKKATEEMRLLEDASEEDSDSDNSDSDDDSDDDDSDDDSSGSSSSSSGSNSSSSSSSRSSSNKSSRASSAAKE